MAIERLDDADDEKGSREQRLVRMMGPGQVDQQIRGAIQTVWMMLPDERKSVDEVEREFRRIADRAFRDLREDMTAFGLGA